jgi:integrase/recombinase XerD
VSGDDVARALLIPSMTKRYSKRGRPPGTSGRAAVLTRAQVRHVFRVARARGRYADRAEAVFALSVGLGLRAKELAALKWADVYEADGKVRPVMHLKAAYTKGAKTRDVFVSSPSLRKVLARYSEERWLMSATASQTALFPSQKGGYMTPASMARFLKYLYREAGLTSASSHSGRRTLITGLAERGVDLKAIAEIAGHSTIRTTAMYVESNPKRLARILQDVTF